jgi:outer membrane protein
MRNFYLLAHSCLILLCCTQHTLAQRSAFLNFGNLITDMPETKIADTELEAYQKVLVAKGEEMAARFQEVYAAFVKDVQSGEVTPEQQQQRQEQLQKQQQEILNYEQEVTKKLSEKREELLEPVLEKAGNIIRDVAQEKGIAGVFDTSVFNSVLFGDNSFDMEPLVRNRMGLPFTSDVPFVEGTAVMAFVNSAEILARLPVIKQAESQLEELQKQFQRKGQSMVEQLQQNYLAVQQKVERGELSPVQQEEEAAKLKARESEISKFEQDMVNQIQDKRTELLQPIYNHVNEAIAIVAKRENVQLVFEQSVMLYFEENLNLSDLVMAQLGLSASGAGTFIGGIAAYGAVNSTELLGISPDVKQAESQLEELQKQFQRKGQSMVEQLQQESLAVQQQVERGELSPVQQEEEAAKLKARESEIAKLENDMVKQIQDKWSELLEPIYNKINGAIANVAKEQNLSVVYDMGILVKSDPAFDVSPLVKRKLGM